MKILAILMFSISSVFAQATYTFDDLNYHDPYGVGSGHFSRSYFPYPDTFPIPGSPRYPYQYCSQSQVNDTIKLVQSECSEKLADFSADHLVTCSITSSSLFGCRAKCFSENNLYAKIRLDVNSYCQRPSANLRKTVIKYYR